MTGRCELRVALLWHTFCHDNLGVDALSRADAAIIELAGLRLGLDIKFITFGSGQRPDVIDLPESVQIGPAPSLKQIILGRSHFFTELKKCDLVVDIGEGDSFTDIYGIRRFCYQVSSKALAVILRKPIILAPQTIGPFDNPLCRWIAARLISRLTSVFTRDYMSTLFLKSLKTKVLMDEFIDVAFGLPFTKRKKNRDDIDVGINVSGLLFNGGYTGNNELGMSLDYAVLMERLIIYFQSVKGVKVYLFSHVAGNGGPDDDSPVINELGRKHFGVAIVSPFSTSIEAKNWMSGLDFVIAGRMHACIGAFSAGVPIVPVAYSRKFNGLFTTLNYPYFIDGKATSTEKAFSDIVAWFESRNKLSLAILNSQPLIFDRLNNYEDKLVSIMSEIVNKMD